MDLSKALFYRMSLGAKSHATSVGHQLADDTGHPCKTNRSRIDHKITLYGAI